MAGWQLGVFNSDGRFEDVDACRILPDAATLAPLVSNGAREPGDSEPRGFLGLGGDAHSECKWSSVPRGVDRPFRTVRVFAETAHASPEGSGPERAEERLVRWYENRVRRGSEVAVVDGGMKIYGTTDRASYVIVFAQIKVFDIHAKFRISNVVVDVSARTHTEPGEKERAQVVGLAKEVAGRLRALD
ncbi:hypothetical protein E1264_33050 [Actinomadura sp. KC216]|uniref:hypothetical protein n=1 Tax=Actinomadura sp. KC216 TaxID=2530370 RepID=UPI00104ECFB3|nr:hypothetical protein [Actinomadura sp. KC216]TDB81209.1 hypothetical protein E1264_33050 [Actinomadura sp. KC216]